MAGLFGFDDDVRLGLLTAGLGTLAGRGSPLQTLGQGGLLGIQAYTGSKTERERAKREAEKEAVQMELLRAQLENMRSQQQNQLMAQQEAQRKAQAAAAQQAAILGAGDRPAWAQNAGPLGSLVPAPSGEDAAMGMARAGGDVKSMIEMLKMQQPEFGMTLTPGVGPDGKPAFLQPSKRGGAQALAGFAPPPKEAESPLGKVSPGDFTPASIAKFIQSGNFADLMPIDKRPQTNVSVTNDLAPKLPKDYRWKDGRVGQEVEPIPGGPADTSKEDATRAAYRTKSSDVVLELIGEAKERVGHSTVGVGSVMEGIPGTPAANFKALIEPIKANIGFDRLQEMREASKTGGALGQVAVQEINYLQATLGSLDRAQSPKQFKESLERVEKHYKNATALIARIQAGRRAAGASGDFREPESEQGGLTPAEQREYEQLRKRFGRQ